MKAGDVVAFAGSGIVSGLISLLTFGGISHVGIIAEVYGKLRLVESDVDGVVASPIDCRITAYDGRVWHYPLTRDLYAHEHERLSDFAETTLGRRYDTAGALKAGGWLTAALKAKASKPDLSTLFCSELVAACHNAVGLFPTANAARWSPNSLVRAERLAGLLGPHKRLK